MPDEAERKSNQLPYPDDIKQPDISPSDEAKQAKQDVRASEFQNRLGEMGFQDSGDLRESQIQRPYTGEVLEALASDNAGTSEMAEKDDEGKDSEELAE